MKFITPIFILISSFAFAQEQDTPPKVLKALPLDFEADLQEPESSTPSPTAPPTTPSEPESTPIDSSETDTSPLDQKPTGDDAVRLQIFLDQANFGPGVIDGKIGRFSELAAQSWNENKGHPISSWTAVNTAARESIANPYATAIVPDIASKWVNPKLPYKRTLQAKVTRMSYRSLGEFMSERYHTTVPYLIELNGASKINSLKPRDSIIVPNVPAFQIEDLTGAAFKEDEILSQRYAVVDTKLNQIRIYEPTPKALVVADPDSPTTVANQGLVAAFPITPGKPQFIRYGVWQMRNAVELPTWRYDQQLLDTGKRSKNAFIIPGGPNNPVGVLWCGLSKPGIGLHGTSDPETIGRSQSAGCIRLANWDIVRIPHLLRPGSSVEIR